MDRPTKVLFLIPSLGRGGAETQLMSLVNGIENASIEKHLVSFEADQNLLTKLDQSKCRYEHIPRRGRLDRYLPQQLAQYIDDQQISVVHATLQISGYYAQKAISLAQASPDLIIAVHSNKGRSLKETMLWYTIFQKPMRSARKLVFVADTQRMLWCRRFPWLKHLSITIHNGIDPTKFDREDHLDHGQQLRKDLNIPLDTPIVCSIAAFRPEKNHALLMRAVSQCKQHFAMIMAGDGPLRRDTETLAHQLGIQDKVHFIGRVDDVRATLAASCLSVISSDTEAFSMAMLESLAMQVPMLSTNVGGMGEAIINHQTGLLVPPGNVQAFSEALDQLIATPETLRTLGHNAGRLVRQKFTRCVMIDKTTRVLLDPQ